VGLPDRRCLGLLLDPLACWKTPARGSDRFARLSRAPNRTFTFPAIRDRTRSTATLIQHPSEGVGHQVVRLPRALLRCRRGSEKTVAERLEKSVSLNRVPADRHGGRQSGTQPRWKSPAGDVLNSAMRVASPDPGVPRSDRRSETEALVDGRLRKPPAFIRRDEFQNRFESQFIGR
jgi:hypothetical protein